MKKKLSALLLTAVIAAAMTACRASDDSGSTSSASSSSQTEADAVETEAATVETEPAAEHYEIDLTAGNYIAGKDLPVGTYNITANSGSGNVSSSNMYAGGLNEVIGTDPSDGISEQSFNGLQMDQDVVLSVGGNVSIHLTAENAEVSAMTPRAAADGTPVDLGAGNYTAGTDFPAGTYNIVATGSMGNVSSDNMYDGGLNEILSTDNSDGMSISQFNNAQLPEGTVLTISGTTIQLVPVGE